jgi:sulfur-carrier protein
VACIAFTPNLARHVSCPASEAAGHTVGEVLGVIFAANPVLASYVLDDQGAVRKHMSIFIDGRQIRDRAALSDPVTPNAQIYVAQALSGG